MESVDRNDRHLDPPDGPTHWECDGCGEMFDGGDLWQIGKRDEWYCDECYEEYKFQEALEMERE